MKPTYALLAVVALLCLSFATANENKQPDQSNSKPGPAPASTTAVTAHAGPHEDKPVSNPKPGPGPEPDPVPPSIPAHAGPHENKPASNSEPPEDPHDVDTGADILDKKVSGLHDYVARSDYIMKKLRHLSNLEEDVSDKMAIVAKKMKVPMKVYLGMKASMEKDMELTAKKHTELAALQAKLDARKIEISKLDANLHRGQVSLRNFKHKMDQILEHISVIKDTSQQLQELTSTDKV